MMRLRKAAQYGSCCFGPPGTGSCSLSWLGVPGSGTASRWVRSRTAGAAPFIGVAEWMLGEGPLPDSIFATRFLEIVYFVLPTQYSICPSFSVALVTTMYMPFFK